MPDDPSDTQQPTEQPPHGPKAETAEGHTGRDDVSYGLNSNLDPAMGSTGGDAAATEDIVDQQRGPDGEEE